MAHKGFYWGQIWETNIIESTEYGKILCYGAKWEGGRTFSRGLIDFKRNREYQLVKELRELLDRADLVIGHNEKAFDIKWCNTKFAYYKLPPPSPFKVSDTKTEAKKYFYLPSYKLDNIADYFGLGRKLEHEGFPMWKRCMAGDRASWAKMMRYCRNDVNLDAKVMKILKPFVEIKGIWSGACTHCGSKNLQSRGLTLDGKKRRVACRDCAGWSTISIKSRL